LGIEVPFHVRFKVQTLHKNTYTHTRTDLYKCEEMFLEDIQADTQTLL